MTRKILLASTALLGLSSIVQAQDVVVMRRTIARPNMRAPEPTPTPGATSTPGSTTPTPTPGVPGGATPTPTPTPGAPGGTAPTPTPTSGVPGGTTPTPTPTSGSPTPTDAVRWYTTPWVVQPACGPTVQTSVASCLDAADRQVDDSRCIAAIGPKPPESNATTSYATCTYTWITGEWGPWSSTCNASATHTRSVDCRRDYDGEIVTTSQSTQYCKDAVPASSETARITTDCKYQWKKTWTMAPTGIKGTSKYGPWTVSNFYQYVCWDTSTNKQASSDTACDTRILGAKPAQAYTPALPVEPTLDMRKWTDRGWYPDWFAVSDAPMSADSKVDIVARETFVVDTPLNQNEIVSKAHQYCLPRIAGYYNASPVYNSYSNNQRFPSSCEVSQQYRIKATGKVSYEIVLSATFGRPFAGRDLYMASMGSSPTTTVIPTVSGGFQNYTMVRSIKSSSGGVPANYYISSTPDESGCKMVDDPTVDEYLCKPD